MKKIPLLLTTVVMMTALSSCGGREASNGANPLLSEWDTPYGVPPFDKIEVSDYMPAFREAMRLHEEEIEAIAENSQEPDFENTVLAFDNSGEMLTRVELVFWWRPCCRSITTA